MKFDQMSGSHQDFRREKEIYLFQDINFEILHAHIEILL